MELLATIGRIIGPDPAEAKGRGGGPELTLLVVRAADTIPRKMLAGVSRERPWKLADFRRVSTLASNFVDRPGHSPMHLLYSFRNSVDRLPPSCGDRPWLAVGLCLAILASGTGCNQTNPLLANRPAMGWPNTAQSPPAAWNQTTELDRRRSQALDADNRDLHSELAKSQQQYQLQNDKLAMLSKQLNDTVAQLQAVQLAKQEADRRAETMQASMRMRGGATITANNSLARSLEVINIPSVEVRRDNEVIRIEMSADRLFVAGTAQFQGSAQYLLDQVADAVARNYSRQMIGIEAHTDPNPAGAVITQQLATSQALAVYSAFAARSRLPANQLFTVAHGANHPLASNGTPSGRSKNRRIEVVIYPETVGQR